MKVAVILGTRPEAIKLAPIVKALDAHPQLQGVTCVTGQHKEMLTPLLKLFDIRPVKQLEVMKPGQDLSSLSATLLEGITAFLKEQQPDLVLVQGDTTTAFCGTLASFYQKIPVGHVEAGLRTGDLLSPWPEEANRVLISRLARLHFAPTQCAQQHLLHEHIPPAHIFVTGNPVIDTLFLTRSLPYVPSAPILPHHLMQSESPLVLITGHRRENFDGGLHAICRAIKRLSSTFTDTHFVYPLHLNPNVRATVHTVLTNNGETTLPNVHLIEPLSYQPFVKLLERSTLILTDSGGIQEEAPSLGKPVLVLRDKTERPEAIEAGTVELVGTDEDLIVKRASTLLTNKMQYQSMARAINPYGDGKASERILDICHTFLKL